MTTTDVGNLEVVVKVGVEAGADGSMIVVSSAELAVVGSNGAAVVVTCNAAPV